ncbi:amidase signature domain-containing protein [Diplogelasinospora grovesii]|uniref:Glutamyl-tRNA(Gln) amidotransferase subunit A, mitochondrial n=1 Tax=Diplogelasinospora grovesii TaxID=303347 RepID=A0AAN6NCW6_9PEZI|nr:amidase signature domain-containing protein [Diplogelasinospora grovesii]
MSARSTLTELHLRHAIPTRHQVVGAATQRRYLNQFICKAPQSSIPQDVSPSSSPATLPRFRLAVKDNIATASSDLPTTCASRFLPSYKSPFEATIVTQLRARGATVVGKTNLDEFGMGSHSVHSAFGAVVNETDGNGQGDGPRLSAGGSSGGSAMAVAAGEADVALGTDTGGSVRLPAAYTGVVGFKPSYGMLSRHGVVPYANSLDTVGLLAPSAAAISDLVIGRRSNSKSSLWAEHDPKDPTSLLPAARERCAQHRRGYHEDRAEDWPSTLQGLTFGIPLEYNIEELDPCIRDAWAAAAALVRHELNARIVPVSLPSTRHALSAYYVIAPAEASSNLAKYDGVRYGRRANDDTSDSDAADGVLYAASRGQGFGEEVRRRILLGSYTLSSEAMDNYFIQAQRVRRLVRRDFDRVFALSNPLAPEEDRSFDLSDLPDHVVLEDKFGPSEVDFLLCPTAPTLPPRLEDVFQQKSPVDAYMNDVFTVPASLAGLPAISIPIEVSATSGNVSQQPSNNVAGMQLIGQYWDDARLLAVADRMAKLFSDEHH